MTRTFKTSVCLLALCIAAANPAFAQMGPAPQVFPAVKPNEIAVPQAAPDPASPEYMQTLSGNYLSSMFAQKHHDWRNAKIYLQDLLARSPDDPQLLKRSMILAIGSGEIKIGMEFARRVEKLEPTNALALLFLSVEDFHNKKYEEANGYIAKMSNDSLAEFVAPLLKAWSQAAEGKAEIKGLDKNIIHINHAVLISDFLKQYDQLDDLLATALKSPQASTGDLMIIGDVYAHIGDKEKAMELYEKVQQEYPDEPVIIEKIEALKTGKSTVDVKPVKDARQGLATALLDMAKLLYREYSDDSARVFANLALYLDPKISDADLLLGSITARNKRYDEAIDYYRKITPDNPYFLESRRKAADLLLDAGRREEALDELEKLANEHNDTDSLIRVGDIYRQGEQFNEALDVYNAAAKKLGNPIPKEYWYLYYVRGISYERAGQWALAEKDLKTALTYQPDHPYVLNYLGYAWADQGVNLKEALDMVTKASDLMPEDGYIMDSLGWIYFKMGQYQDATEILEHAVQLLPQDSTVNHHLGDAYWQTGRKREANFQWNRAKNFSKDPAFKAAMSKKLADGPRAPVEEARTHATGAETGNTTATP